MVFLTKMDYQGVIIEESLEDKKVLDRIKIVGTKVEQVIEKHKTPWVKQWTLHTIEVSEEEAQKIAEEISENLDSEHSWYADFKNDKYHYIIFKGKVFCIDVNSKEQYNEAKKYGISLGIPEYQVRFSTSNQLLKVASKWVKMNEKFFEDSIKKIK